MEDLEKTILKEDISQGMHAFFSVESMSCLVRILRCNEDSVLLHKDCTEAFFGVPQVS
jgi:hypothetical protein